MTLRRNEQSHMSTYGTSAAVATGTSSAFSSPLPIHNGFSTRTRLRPGGPHSQQQQQSTVSAFHDNPTNNSGTTCSPFRAGFVSESRPAVVGTSKSQSTSNNGSLPSFEEIGMRTLSSSSTTSQNNHDPNRGGQFLLNRRPYFSTMMKNVNTNHHPSTPLVKQKTAGCSSPRVQMYRTRVVYSDARDAIKAAQEAAV